MAEFTGIGQGTYNTVAGSIGLASAVLPQLFGNGGLFGGTNGVSRETFDLSMQLSASQRDNAILTAELSSEKKMVEVFNATNERINAVRDELGSRIVDLEKKVSDNAAAQAVINCGLSSSIGVLQTQMQSVLSMTKLGILNSSLWPAASGTGTT